MPNTKAKKVNILINGKKQSFSGPAPDLAALLAKRGYEDKTVAVALNGQFIPKSAYAAQPLKDGDEIEIVAPMQGG